MKDEEEPEKEKLEEGKSYVRLLLKYRPRTEKEIREKLGEKNYEEGTIEELIVWGKENGLIDDRLFSKFWIEDRLSKKPKGRSGLYKELLDHGVDKLVAKEVLGEKLDSDREEKLLEELAEKRLDRYRNDDLKAKYRKTADFLIRRGFSKGAVHSLLKGMLFDGDD